jgi:hypothetical protein
MVEGMMKRDMDLVRSILLKLEESQSSVGPQEIVIDDASPEQIWYHVRLLDEARLIEGTSFGGQGQRVPEWLATRLTWEGHDFLDAARNEAFWAKAKTKLAAAGGGLSLGVLKLYLESLAKEWLGIP